ncbi:hypothetical protein MKEN_00414100 [Mycena kentingensis (nom. inval.)]|nr:hypothetical protein MKEN_00414100 [Mycena kentingensis (nom. inval.)]
MSALRATRLIARTMFRPATRVAAVSTSRPIASRNFSASTRVWRQTSASLQLLNKLGEELAYETNSREENGDGKSDEILAFEEEGTWKIEDIPGNDEVFLTRRFGDETLRVMFSIADVQSLDSNDIANPELDEDGEPEDVPEKIRVVLSIAKDTHPGALNVELFCTEGELHTASLAFFKNGKFATEMTLESDFARRVLYSGPAIETLDVTLQENFDEYLRERGIDETLATFIPAYATWKEQQEYVSWLEGVTKFIEA